MPNNDGNIVKRTTQYIDNIGFDETNQLPMQEIVGPDGSGNIYRAKVNSSGQLAVEANVSATLSGADGAIEDGVDSGIRATVKDLTNSNPLTVAVTDSNGDQITSFGGGTEYTEGATDASITGSAVMWEDTSDTLRPVSASKPLPVDVKNSSIPVTDNGGSLTVDGTVTVQDGGGTISIDDGGGTITVDGSVGVTGTVTVDSELTTGDLDTGAGTDTRAVVGLVGAKSGGGVLIPGDATAGLKVDLGADNDVTITSGTVTVQDGGSTISVDDGGGALTVDGTVAVTGVSTATNQTNGSQKSQIVDGSGNVIGATANALDVNIKSGSSSGTQYTEGDADATITGTAILWEDGSDVLRAVSAAKPLPVDIQDSTVAVTDNGGSLTVDGTVTVQDGGSTISVDDGGASLTVDGTVTETNSSAIKTSVELIDDAIYTDGTGSPSKAIGIAGTDGTNPQIIKTDASGELQVDVLTMPTTTVTATNLDIRDLTFAADKVDASGSTLGSNSGVDIGDVTINNAAGASAVNIQDGGNSITVDGTVSVTGVATATKQSDGSQKSQIVDGAGNVIGATSNALDVNIKSGATSGTQYTEADTDASITGTAIMWEDSGDTLRAVSASKPLPVDLQDTSVAVTDNGGSLTVDDGGSSLTVDGAVTVSGDVGTIDQLDLTNSNPAAVAIVDGNGDQITSFGGGTQYTEGDADASITGTAILWEDGSDVLRAVSAAKPLPVDLQDTSVAVTDNGGSLTVDDGGGSITVDAASLPLPTGAATLAEQQTQTTALQLLDDTVATDGAAAPTKGIMLAGTDGTNAQTIKTDTNGELQVDVLSMPTTTVSATDLDVRNLVFATDKVDVSGSTLAANSGVDIGDVTINNASGGSAVNIQDGGNSITVDNGGTFVTQENGAALTALQLMDDTVFADDAAFTVGVSKVNAVGFIADETSTDSVDEGDVGAPRMTLDRRQIATLTPHTQGGLTTYHLVSGASTNATNVKASAGQLYGYYIYNSNASARKVAFHNTSGTPTAGASVFFSVVIPASSAANVEFTNGVAFSSGIGITTTTGIADSDSAAVAANDLVINLFYK